MSKKGGANLERREAVAIATKLKATIRNGGKHDIAAIKLNGVLVANYGIRHDRKAQHSYISKQIHVSQAEAIKLANCTMSYDAWCQKIIAAGLANADGE